jgi:hypothetical protein
VETSHRGPLFGDLDLHMRRPGSWRAEERTALAPDGRRRSLTTSLVTWRLPPATTLHTLSSIGRQGMADYTPLGIEIIARQAAHDLSLIRCPRDSVVMRVLASRAEQSKGGNGELREFRSRPPAAGWRVVELDVECPACRRRASGIRPDPRPLQRPPVASPPASGVSPTSLRV